MPVRGGCQKTWACGRMGYLLSKIFPPVGRSSQSDSKGGVAGRKQCHWESRRGDLTTTEDSRDEGGVVGV